MRINSVHESPVLLASKGHAKVALVHPRREPSQGPPGVYDSPQYQRRARRDAAKARKREVRQGAPFLRRLTSTRYPTGRGVNQGAVAPSRLPGHLPPPK
jgi:hypothetical protein